MKNKSTYELCVRINEIAKEMDNLQLEHNKIVSELYERMPHLKDDVNIQPKVKVRKYENNRFIK
jgi:hypothetical protein